MTRKHTRRDVVGAHVFMHVVMFLMSLAFLALGVVGVTYFEPLGMANPVWVRVMIAVGIFGLLVFPVLAVANWPKRDDE